jgi:hypothetical protein
MLLELYLGLFSKWTCPRNVVLSWAIPVGK